MVVDPREDPYNQPPNSLHIVIPFIPPTSNSIYVTVWKQRRIVKSKEATTFYTRFLSEVVPRYLPWISRMTPSPSSVYEVRTIFFLDQWDILNKGWFQTPRSAKSRYKKMDTGNRLKLIHDCLSDAIGVDDSHFFNLGASKLCAQEWGVEPQVHVFLSSMAAPKDPVGTQLSIAEV